MLFDCESWSYLVVCCPRILQIFQASNIAAVPYERNAARENGGPWPRWRDGSGLYLGSRCHIAMDPWQQWRTHPDEVMEERGSLSMVPEEKDSDCEVGFQRACKQQLNSFGVWSTWPRCREVDWDIKNYPEFHSIEGLEVRGRSILHVLDTWESLAVLMIPEKDDGSLIGIPFQEWYWWSNPPMVGLFVGCSSSNNNWSLMPGWFGQQPIWQGKIPVPFCSILAERWDSPQILRIAISQCSNMQ